MKNSYLEELKIETYPSMMLHQFGVNGKVSGSIFVTHEVPKAIAIVHGACGCAYHYRFSARTSYYPFFHVVSSDLTDADIVFNGEKKLMQTIQNTYEYYKPELIVVIPTPVCDIIQDDIVSIVHTARESYGIPVIVAKSELFSHRDKNYSRRRLKAISEQKLNESKTLDFDIKGCGYTEVLYAMVEQLMKPCTIKPKTVNIETIGWGADGEKIINEISETLLKVGVHVNCFFPACDARQIASMPCAELNIVKRIHWAKRMRELFNTPYLQIDNGGRYAGLHGIVNFFEDIGNVLGIDNMMREIVSFEKEGALQLVSKDLKEINTYKAFIIANQIQSLPYMIKKYKESYNMNIVGCNLYITDHTRKNLGITDDVFENLLNRIKDSINLYYPNMKFYINATMDELKEHCIGSDVLVGTNNFRYEEIGVPMINPRHDEISLSFQSYVRSVKRMNSKLKSAVNHSKLLLNKLEYHHEYFPLPHVKNIHATKDMWYKMWLEKGGER